MRTHAERLSALQQLHYASGRYAVLLIFQGMDTAGKDGNPEGCEVFSFEQPSAEELQHDFLWRTTCKLPERGRIGIFNRSYYEEVLITRVHPEILAGQNLPRRDAGNLWNERYHSIAEFEKHLHRNGTQIIEFFLHLSKKEQARWLVERIDNPYKNWKFSESDIHERKYWPQYMKAYADCLAATTAHHAAWYVVPADE